MTWTSPAASSSMCSSSQQSGSPSPLRHPCERACSGGWSTGSLLLLTCCSSSRHVHCGRFWSCSDHHGRKTGWKGQGRQALSCDHIAATFLLHQPPGKNTTILQQQQQNYHNNQHQLSKKVTLADPVPDGWVETGFPTVEVGWGDGRGGGGGGGGVQHK